MSWKRFREFFKSNRAGEQHFILGIDLGNCTSTISYFDHNSQNAEIIDISGGYGKPNVPTALQYAAENREWIFGEYAILNANGTDALIRNFGEKLGSRGYLDIAGRTMAITEILGIFLGELIASCKNINPKAEIAGIICTAPSYISAEAKEELIAVFRACGFERTLIEIISDRECALRNYFYSELDDKPVKERLLMLDYGAREMRAQIFDINPDNSGAEASRVGIECISSHFDARLGCDRIDSDIFELFAKFYYKAANISREKLSKVAFEQLLTFAYQHKDMLFAKSSAKSGKNNDIRLYYNFMHPPFSASLSMDDIKAIVSPYRAKFREFLSEMHEKTLESKENPEIDTILLCGGGFEMSWARLEIARLYPNAKIITPRNPKGFPAQGATIIATERLGIRAALDIKLADFHKVPWDIGVMVYNRGLERFLPIVEGGSFWWQHRKPLYFMLQDETSNAENSKIDFFLRDTKGRIKSICTAELTGLPRRPPGTTKLAINLAYTAQLSFTVGIEDSGFGEFFPASDYQRNFNIALTGNEFEA